MPNVTVSTEYGEQIPLKSAAGAYVRVRPLPFGKRLDMRDKASKMYFEMPDERRPKDSSGDPNKAYIETMQKWSRAFEMDYCIGEHNLEDAKGNNLDFGNPMTLDILDPKVGLELEKLLDALNGTEDEESMEDFLKQHTSVSDSQTEVSTPPELNQVLPEK